MVIRDYRGAKITFGLFLLLNFALFYKKAKFCEFIYLSLNPIKDRVLNGAHYLRFATKMRCGLF